MSNVRFKDVCIDANDAEAVSGFWAAALGGEREPDDMDEGYSVRVPKVPTIWINRVGETKMAKNRVHFDVYAASIGPLLELGATVVAEREQFTVLADPDGNEFCAFADTSVDEPPMRIFAVCTDSARPTEIAAWWQRLLGGRLDDGPDGTLRYLHDGAGLGHLVWKFIPVDDERSVKNRCHWDVTTDAVATLVRAGASVIREPDDRIEWTIMTDPDGNEFCAFT